MEIHLNVSDATLEFLNNGIMNITFQFKLGKSDTILDENLIFLISINILYTVILLRETICYLFDHEKTILNVAKKSSLSSFKYEYFNLVSLFLHYTQCLYRIEVLISKKFKKYLFYSVYF